MAAEHDAIKSIKFEKGGQYCRLEIIDRGAYQRAFLWDQNIKSGEFCFSLLPDGGYDVWPDWGKMLTAEQMRLIGLLEAANA